MFQGLTIYQSNKHINNQKAIFELSMYFVSALMKGAVRHWNVYGCLLISFITFWPTINEYRLLGWLFGAHFLILIIILLPFVFSALMKGDSQPLKCVGCFLISISFFATCVWNINVLCFTLMKGEVSLWNALAAF